MRLYSIDTSAWVDYLRGRNGPVYNRVREALTNKKDYRVAIDGVVLAELLQGIKHKKDREFIRKHLLQLPYLPLDKALFLEAGRISRDISSKGNTVPLTDVLVATCAVRHGAVLLAKDTHFKCIPGLSYEMVGT